MTKYLIHRVVQMIPILVLISVLVFALLTSMPGDPLDRMLEDNPDFTFEDYMDPPFLAEYKKKYNETPAVAIFASEDEAFAKMRAPGIYQKIKENVLRHQDLRIQISCVITSLTVDCIEDLVAEWGALARGGIIFDFFTPVNKLDEALWLDWDRRDQVIDQLFELKRKYPGVINMLDSTLDLMRSANSKKVTDNCLFKEKAFTLGADGKPKGKCMMGDNADCDKCGCVVPFYMATMNSPRLLLKEAAKKAVGRA